MGSAPPHPTGQETRRCRRGGGGGVSTPSPGAAVARLLSGFLEQLVHLEETRVRSRLVLQNQSAAYPLPRHSVVPAHSHWHGVPSSAPCSRGQASSYRQASTLKTGPPPLPPIPRPPCISWATSSSPPPTIMQKPLGSFPAAGTW